MISSISNLSNLSNNKSALQIINLALSKMKTQAAENEDNEASDIYTYSNPDLAYFAWLALVDENKGDYALDLHSKSALLKALRHINSGYNLSAQKSRYYARFLQFRWKC